MKQLLFLFAVLFLFSCTPKDKPAEACLNNGVIKNKTGLDGCKWVIYDDKGAAYMPVKMDMQFEFEDNKNITFSYTEMKDIMTTCMVGKAVEITCISER